ncbi:MAG: hypothetical protein ACI9US_003195, partial [Gammaproteobacteria bacterium]
WNALQVNATKPMKKPTLPTGARPPVSIDVNTSRSDDSDEGWADEALALKGESPGC